MAFCTTKTDVFYEFNIESSKLVSIDIIEAGNKKTFYLYSEDDESQMTTEIFEAAMEALLRANPCKFDVLSVYLSCEYDEIAVDVYKKVMNELYNLAIADTAFNRKVELTEESLNTTYTLFKE